MSIEIFGFVLSLAWHLRFMRASSFNNYISMLNHLKRSSCFNGFSTFFILALSLTRSRVDWEAQMIKGRVGPRSMYAFPSWNTYDLLQKNFVTVSFLFVCRTVLRVITTGSLDSSPKPCPLKRIKRNENLIIATSCERSGNFLWDVLFNWCLQQTLAHYIPENEHEEDNEMTH